MFVLFIEIVRGDCSCGTFAIFIEIMRGGCGAHMLFIEVVKLEVIVRVACMLFIEVVKLEVIVHVAHMLFIEIVNVRGDCSFDTHAIQ